MQIYEVREAMDLYGPRRAIRELAASIGFAASDCMELAIVVSELTSNILKYGVRGSIELGPFDSREHGLGVVVTARDIGPPFHDLELALRDGYTDRGPIDPLSLLRRGGLGTGLGAVRRLTDSFQLTASPPEKQITVVRYLKRPRWPREPLGTEA